jgi:hypothetical protein
MLVKLKYNRDNIYELNWVPANIVQRFKICYMDIPFPFNFFFILSKTDGPPRVIFQLGFVHNWLSKLPQKSIDKKSPSHVIRDLIHKPQYGAVNF